MVTIRIPAPRKWHLPHLTPFWSGVVVLIALAIIGATFGGIMMMSRTGIAVENETTYNLTDAPAEVRITPADPKPPVDITKLNPPKTEADAATNTLASYIQERFGSRYIKNISIALHSPRFLPRGIGSSPGIEVTPATAVVRFTDDAVKTFGAVQTFYNLPLVGHGGDWALIEGPADFILDGGIFPEECFGETISDACRAALQKLQK